MSGPLTKQIAASVEDVKSLLADNRNLSIALLARRIKDLEEEVRERFRKNEQVQAQRMNSLEDSIRKLEERLRVAGVKYMVMREDLDKLNEPTASSKTNAQ